MRVNYSNRRFELDYLQDKQRVDYSSRHLERDYLQGRQRVNRGLVHWIERKGLWIPSMIGLEGCRV